VPKSILEIFSSMYTNSIIYKVLSYTLFINITFSASKDESEDCLQGAKPLLENIL
jgi:hypothetical protein